jgi:hypothetical protein
VMARSPAGRRARSGSRVLEVDHTISIKGLFNKVNIPGLVDPEIMCLRICMIQI